MDETRQRYLSRLPDLPRWVETRDVLLREGARLLEHPSRNGFVVRSADDGSGSAVGDPEPDALALAAGQRLCCCVKKSLALTNQTLP